MKNRLKAKIKVVALIEARMTSSRLPGKVMMPLAGAPALQRMIERVRRAKNIDQVAVATTVNESDQPIVDLCQSIGCLCFRGSEEDVLIRVLNAARDAKADWIVELTGDCPLMDPKLIDESVRIFAEGSCDYVYNRLYPAYPDGYDVQVFSTISLAELDRLTENPIDRVHVSLYYREHPEHYRLKGVRLPENDPRRRPDLRLTLDEEPDYQLLARIFETLHKCNPDFCIEDVLAYLNANPSLLEINKSIRTKSVEEG